MQSKLLSLWRRITRLWIFIRAVLPYLRPEGKRAWLYLFLKVVLIPTTALLRTTVNVLEATLLTSNTGDISRRQLRYSLIVPIYHTANLLSHQLNEIIVGQSSVAATQQILLGIFNRPGSQHWMYWNGLTNFGKPATSKTFQLVFDLGPTLAELAEEVYRLWPIFGSFSIASLPLSIAYNMVLPRPREQSPFLWELSDLYNNIVEGYPDIRVYQQQPHFAERHLALLHERERSQNFGLWTEILRSILETEGFLVTLMALVTRKRPTYESWHQWTNLVQLTRQVMEYFPHTEHPYFDTAISFLRKEAGDKRPDLQVTDATVVLQHVSYQVLRDIRLTISSGQHVAFVGPNGAGKSTLLRLLEGVEKPDEGKILIDGQDISTVSQKSLTSVLTIHRQEPFLFHKTIEGNIKIGNQNATHEEMITSCMATEIHDTIERFPEQYSTPLRKWKGLTLSGGEEQRLHLARMLLKPCRIVALDEATGYVDPLTELSVYERVLGLLKAKKTTVITITHRHEVARMADYIFFVKEGRITERGTDRQLMILGGDYYKHFSTPQSTRGRRSSI